MLVAGLGLVADGLHRTLRIRRPSLPRSINRLSLNGLRVAGASVDLLFERIADRPGTVALTDVRLDGDIEVVLEVRDPVRSQELAPTLDDVRTEGVAGP
jgi:hypothetical protein